MTEPEEPDVEFEYALAAMDDRLEPCQTDDDLFKTCLEIAVVLATAERGFVLTRGEGRDDYHVAACHGLDPATLWTTAEISSTIIRTAFEKAEPIMSDNAVMDKRFEESTSVVLSALRSVLCLPLRTRGTVVAVFYLDNRFLKGAFTLRQFELLKHLAAKVAARLAHLSNMTRKEPGGGWMDRWRKT